MNKIIIAGAGKIGSLIAFLLSESNDYDVTVVDMNLDSHREGYQKIWGNQYDKIKLKSLDINNKSAVSNLIAEKNIQSVISCLPYFCNIAVAEVCREQNVHYFDLTEDTAVSEKIRSFAQETQAAFVPQCGLAPGFISIAANDLMNRFDSVESVLMRVGALPQYPNNKLKYALNWSTEGLINEYANPCYGIVEGKEVEYQPLEGLETIEIDGLLYEAFNTSGGIGSLAASWGDKVKLMNYKTIRYPGHCELMSFLMNDLKLGQQRTLLKNILEAALPRTPQDLVIVYVAVKGQKNKVLTEEIYAKKIYPQIIGGQKWSAIQVTTASGACAVIDKVLSQPGQYKGLVLQEQFSLNEILENRFGKYYQ